MKIWDCKIGEIDEEKLSSGSNSPMRKAVRQAYKELTGEEPKFIFSGWGGNLTKIERDIVNSRR